MKMLLPSLNMTSLMGDSHCSGLGVQRAVFWGASLIFVLISHVLELCYTLPSPGKSWGKDLFLAYFSEDF